MSNQKGFTLIEIAIVLVIIGLLLGGVLKGQELITSARVRNLISQQDGIKAAFFGFQDRFRAMPGDMPTANEDLACPGLAQCLKGDGNGIITASGSAHDSYCAGQSKMPAAAVCGVAKTFGRSRIGESSGNGSGSKTSRQAVIRPPLRRSMSAALSTICPRETLTMAAVGFIELFGLPLRVEASRQGAIGRHHGGAVQP